jgi:hypothetical protein
MIQQRTSDLLPERGTNEKPSLNLTTLHESFALAQSHYRYWIASVLRSTFSFIQL